MTKLNATAYSFGISVNDAGRRADTIVGELAVSMAEATRFAGRTKTALHEVLRYRPTYERHISRPETKTRRAVINKCHNLQANYYAAAHTFAFYSKRAIASITELATLIPGLVQGGEHYNSTEESYGRTANAVLCSKLILSIPGELQQLAREFQLFDSDEHQIYVAVGNTSVSELVSNMDRPGYAAHFDEVLNIAFIADASEDESFKELSAAVSALDVSVSRAEQILKIFSDSKARCFDGKWDATEISMDLVNDFKDAHVDYSIAGWTGLNTGRDLWNAACLVEEAIKKAVKRLSALGYEQILYSNIVAAQRKIVIAQELKKALTKAVNYWHGEQDEKTRQRKQTSEAGLKESFTAIPAVHRIPTLSILDNPTRGFNR